MKYFNYIGWLSLVEKHVVKGANKKAHPSLLAALKKTGWVSKGSSSVVLPKH